MHRDHIKDFKREFQNVLYQVWQVYPSGRIEAEFGGIRLFESQPPIPKTSISFAGKWKEPPGDKSKEG